MAEAEVSAGRGGGPIQATLRSQPPNSVNGKIRITDQGEVIQQKYGYEPLAEIQSYAVI